MQSSVSGWQSAFLSILLHCWRLQVFGDDYLHASAGDELARAMGLMAFLAREISAQIPNLMAHLQS
jgi:hypothetical protein